MCFSPADDDAKAWRGLDDMSMAGVPGPVELGYGSCSQIALMQHSEEAKSQAHPHGGTQCTHAGGELTQLVK